MTSGRFTPAAATLTSTSPLPGAGTGRSSGTNTSGPPARRMAMAVMLSGRLGIGDVLDEPGGCHRMGACPRRINMASEEDDRPKKKIFHEIGQDLALLSVGELVERIGLLREEI